MPILSFNNTDDIDINEWRWNNIDIAWNSPRYLISALMMDADKIICCGGYNHDKYVDYYDFNKKKFIKLCDMNYDRLCAGICIDHFD